MQTQIMGKASRDKGRRGQREALDMLTSRDWIAAELNNGKESEDVLATDPNGIVWSVEVKNTVSITIAQRKQAMTQAKQRKARWMLMNKIAGTSSWLIQRQGEEPTTWKEHGNKT
jgi:Holliday junction resolvase-like predicted endonuclease